MVDAGRTCPQCHHENQPGSRFCSSCGIALGGDARTDTQVLEQIDVADEYALDRSQFPDSFGLLIVTRTAITTIIDSDTKWQLTKKKTWRERGLHSAVPSSRSLVNNNNK